MLATLFTLCTLTACGFHPVHSNETRAEYAMQIESVEVVTDNSRPAQLLKAEIEDQVNPTAQPSEKLFLLKIGVSESESLLFINPDGTSGRGDFQYTSTYTLSRRFDSKPIDTGTISRVSSYNNAQTADFSTFVSREDARKRGIVELAQDYKLRLANLLPKINDPYAKPVTTGLPRPVPITRPMELDTTTAPFDINDETNPAR